MNRTGMRKRFRWSIGVAIGQGLVTIILQKILEKGAALASILVGVVMFFGQW